MISLKTTDLSCIRDDRLLFKQLNIDLLAGQLLLVEGENGSGKTSLLRILCGIRLPEQGEVIWQNQHGEAASVHAQGHYNGEMAFLGHQDGNKLDLTVVENLSFTQSLALKNTCDIEDVLNRVGLAFFDDIFVSNLSAGQRRRLAIARLLLSGASLWVLDEPFTAMDTKGVAMVEREIGRHLQQGGLVIMTSHHQVSVNPESLIKINLSQ